MSGSPLQFFFDFSSPYGYLAAQKIDALAAQHGRTVDWRPMLLGVVFKQTGGAPLTEVPVKGPYSKHDFARSARFHGIEFRMPPVFPIPAQAPARIVLWAKQGNAAGAAQVAKALYRAYFVDGLDISQPDVAAEVAGRAGFDAAAARAAVDDPAIKDALRREVEAAIAAGVFGSPFVIVDGEPFWGMDRFDQLERWLARGPF
ncbi:MAG: 2-hydroxychromene-2-carboxylate isomerase [Betaproteobacteria bacterium]|nr:2-hydroxychromene-2-carboxylate isomerase [Betaproteobacteria bacterium]